MVFHWRLRDNKSPQISRTLLSILAVFNHAVIWMASTRPPTSKSSRPFNNPLVVMAPWESLLLPIFSRQPSSDRTYTRSIQYPFTDQILLSNTSYSFKNTLWYPYQNYFSGFILFNLELLFFFAADIFNPIQQFFPKIYNSINKTSNWLVGVVFWNLS